jgi:Ca2+-binding EF-hand superfamily protein
MISTEFNQIDAQALTFQLDNGIHGNADGTASTTEVNDLVADADVNGDGILDQSELEALAINMGITLEQLVEMLRANGVEITEQGGEVSARVEDVAEGLNSYFQQYNPGMAPEEGSSAGNNGGGSGSSGSEGAGDAGSGGCGGASGAEGHSGSSVQDTMARLNDLIVMGDLNRDNMLNLEELTEMFGEDVAQDLMRFDENGDGNLTLAELTKAEQAGYLDSTGEELAITDSGAAAIELLPANENIAYELAEGQ